MPASLGTPPVALVPPFGAAPQLSTFDNANRRALSDGIGVSDSRVNLILNPSFEVDASNWSVVGLCTVARSTADAWTGSASLLMTATSTGTFTARAATNSTVTNFYPAYHGRTYTASAYMKLASGTRTARMVMQFYNAAGTLLTTTNGATYTLSSSAWSRVGVVHQSAPANTAYVMVTVAAVTTGAVGDAFYVDGVMLEAGLGGAYFDGSSDGCGWVGTAHASASFGPLRPAYRMNMVRGPGLEVPGTGFTPNGGTTGTTSIDTTTFYQGNSSQKLSVNTAGVQPSWYAGSAVIASTSLPYQPCLPGETYTISLYLKADRPGLYGQIRSTGGNGPNVALSDTDWTRLTLTYTINNTIHLFSVYMVDLSGTYPLGQAIWVDNVLWEKASSVLDWFDGDTAGAAWGGPPNQSVSLMPTNPSAASSGQGRATTDDVTLADAMDAVYVPTQLVDDALTVADTASGATAASRAADDALTAADTATGQVALTAAAPDTLTAADSFTGPGSSSRALSDTVTVSDSATGLVAADRQTSDTLAPGDALTGPGSLSRALTDLLACDDTASGAATMTRTAQDTLTSADAVTGPGGASRAAGDSLQVSDGCAAATGSARAVADQITAADTAAVASSASSALADTLTAADTVTAQAALTSAAADTITASSAATRTTTVTSAVADTLTCADTAAPSCALTRGVADTLTATDTPVSPGGQQRAAADAVTATDTATAAGARTRTAPDTLIAADTVTAAVTRAPVPAADALTVADTATGVVSLARTGTDGASLTDAATATAATRSRPAADTLAATDVVARRVDAARPVTDTATLADLAAASAAASRAALSTLTVAATVTGDVILGTPPPAQTPGGAGMTLTGAPGVSGLVGTAGASSGRGSTGNVYARGSRNESEAVT